MSNSQLRSEKVTNSCGPQKNFEAQSVSSDDGTGSWAVSPTVRDSEVGKFNKILVSHMDQTIGPLSDHGGRDVNLPLEGPVSFPLLNSQGGFVTAAELKSIPLSVELGEHRKKELLQQKNGKSRWSLQEEIAKVIEKGFSLGYVYKVRGREEEGGESAKGNSDQQLSWSMGVEIAKVIEVGVALGVDFNGNKDSLGSIIAQREGEDIERLAENAAN